MDAGLPQPNRLVHVAVVAQAQKRPVGKREAEDVSHDAQNEATEADLVDHVPVLPQHHLVQDFVERVGCGGG